VTDRPDAGDSPVHTHTFNTARLDTGPDPTKPGGHVHRRRSLDPGWTSYDGGHAHRVPVRGAGQTGTPESPPSRRAPVLDERD
jgi:hypothetical protein